MDGARQKQVAEEVGEAFVGQYYNTYTTDPKQLVMMYDKQKSVFCHTPVSAKLEFSYGRDAIAQKLAAEGTEIKFKLHTADFVPSVDGSVIIIVQGVKLTQDSTRIFYHTFLLGQVHGSYYIHNDIMRICDPDEDEVEEEEEEEEEAQVPPVQQPAAVPARAVPAAPVPAEKPKPVQQAAPQRPAAPATPEPVPVPEPAAPEAEAVAEAVVEAEEEVQPQEEKPVFSTWASMITGSKATSDSAKPARVVGGLAAAPGSKKPVAATKPAVAGKTGAGKKGAWGIKGAEREGKGEKGGKGADRRERRERDVNYSFYSLYVSHLPASFKETDIAEVFGKFGEVKDQTFQDGRLGSVKRCYVDYDSKEAMEAALSGEVKFNGETLHVQERKSPAQRMEEKGAKKDAPRGKGKGHYASKGE